MFLTFQCPGLPPAGKDCEKSKEYGSGPELRALKFIMSRNFPCRFCDIRGKFCDIRNLRDASLPILVTLGN